MPATVIAERIGWQRGIKAGGGAAPALSRTRSLSTHGLSSRGLAQWYKWEPPVDIPLGYGHVGRLPVGGCVGWVQPIEVGPDHWSFTSPAYRVRG
jgi:hypothetical protein